MGGDRRQKKKNRFFKCIEWKLHKLSMTGQPKGGCRYYKCIDLIRYNLSTKELPGKYTTMYLGDVYDGRVVKRVGATPDKLEIP